MTHRIWGLCVRTVATLLSLGCTIAFGQAMPRQVPDAWLLANGGPPWWYTSNASPTPATIGSRPPTAAERSVIARAHALLAGHTAKAIALLDGPNVVYVEYKSPANESSLFMGFSVGKTVTAMAVGQALCAGKLGWNTKAADLVPGLVGKPLGEATVRDLLMMASGAADVSETMTQQQFRDWQAGTLDLAELVSEDRLAQAARSLFSTYKPGEHFFYKNTDPSTLGLMLNAATGMPYAQWVQRTVLDPMGAARTGLLAQDRQQHGLAEAAVRLHLDDWMRFAWWVKESSMEKGCFGDFVRAASRTQIRNPGSPATRKTGALFDGYGYLTWTDNEIAPASSWAIGYGGQRIEWSRDNDRMALVFSNSEEWISDFYVLARDWDALASSPATASAIAPGASKRENSTGDAGSTLLQQLRANDEANEGMVQAIKSQVSTPGSAPQR